MSKPVKVVINERHMLIPNQSNMLSLEFGRDTWETVEIEDKKWSSEYFREFQMALERSLASHVVFVSPAPLLIARMAFKAGNAEISMEFNSYPRIWIMHSENRIERTIGKITRYIPDRLAYKLILI